MRGQCLFGYKDICCLPILAESVIKKTFTGQNHFDTQLNSSFSEGFAGYPLVSSYWYHSLTPETEQDMHSLAKRDMYVKTFWSEDMVLYSSTVL